MTIHLPAFGPDLPVHRFTGLTAIGFRRNGAPIWPIKGGAPEEGETEEAGDAADDDEQPDTEDADKLGDPGKKALDVMKGQRNKARADLRPWAALARDLGVRTPDEVRNLLQGKKADGGDAPDPEQIRREARAEIERETARDRLLDKIEAKAGGKFADPADAAALLLRENDAEDFLDGTRIDAAAVAEALDDLLERKPYLAAKTAGRPPKPDKSQGNRGGKTVTARDQAMAEIEKRFGKKPATT